MPASFSSFSVRPDSFGILLRSPCRLEGRRRARRDSSLRLRGPDRRNAPSRRSRSRRCGLAGAVFACARRARLSAHSALSNSERGRPAVPCQSRCDRSCCSHLLSSSASVARCAPIDDRLSPPKRSSEMTAAPLGAASISTRPPRHRGVELHGARPRRDINRTSPRRASLVHRSTIQLSHLSGWAWPFRRSRHAGLRRVGP